MAFALAEGQQAGSVTGFVGGLCADLLSDHALGRLALALAVVGHLAGRVHDDTERSTLLPFAVVGAAAAGALLLYAGEGLLLGDPRVGPVALLRGLVSSVPYAVVAVPFVVPLCGRDRGTRAPSAAGGRHERARHRPRPAAAVRAAGAGAVDPRHAARAAVVPAGARRRGLRLRRQRQPAA